MERSIGDELCYDTSKMANMDPRPVTDREIHNSKVCQISDSDGDVLWYDDDGALYERTVKLENADGMEREWQRRREQFHTIGYRDGLMAGKEASAQEGFNIGFKQSVFVGQKWGLVRGVTSALACLPDALQVRLVETEDKISKFQHLHESVRVFSTTEALQLFHDRQNTQTSPRDGDLHSQCPEENFLEHHIREFNSFVLECSAIKLHLE